MLHKAPGLKVVSGYTVDNLLSQLKSLAGGWLSTLPVSSVGLCMEDDLIWIAVGLRKFFVYLTSEALATATCGKHPVMTVWQSLLYNISDPHYDSILCNVCNVRYI